MRQGLRLLALSCRFSHREWPLSQGESGQRAEGIVVIRKLKSGKYRLYSRKKDSRTGKRKNLGTFNSQAAAKKHERAVQYFKRH
jgi:hypothetical protein